MSASFVEAYGDRVGRVMVTLGPAIFKNTEWAHRSIPGPTRDKRAGFWVVMKVTVECPDVCRHSVHGFVRFLAERTIGTAYAMTSERKAPHEVVFEARQRHASNL